MTWRVKKGRKYEKVKFSKEIRSEIRYKDYLERKKTNRKLRAEILKGKEDYELEYLRHLQWQHAIEMSKRYLVWLCSKYCSKKSTKSKHLLEVNDLLIYLP